VARGQGSGVRAGADPSRQRLHVPRGDPLLRLDEAARPRSGRRRAHRGDPARAGRCATARRLRPHPTPARRQPEVPPLLAR